MKKEYEIFKNDLLIKVMECSYCDVKSCKGHKKYLITCNQCRLAGCKNCHKFNESRKILYNAADEIGKDYLNNFIVDFLNISKQSLERYFNKDEIKKIDRTKTVWVKLYEKSNKNKSQVIKNRLKDIKKLIIK